MIMEERLKRFARLIDAGSFTAAAKLLHTSQPALSTAVQKLERELKGELIQRGSRSMMLSPLGKLAYEQGRQLLVLEQNFLHDARNLLGRPQPLRLGCIDSIAELVTRSGGLDTLEAAFELSFVVQSSHVLLGQLRRGELDAVIVVDQPTMPNAVDSYNLGNEHFALVTASHSAEKIRLAQESQLPVPLLAYNKSSTTYAILSRQLIHSGLVFEPRFFSSHPSILMELAQQGKGIAALPTSLIKDSRRDTSTLAELELTRPLKRPITALWPRGRTLPPALSDFLLTLQRLITDS